MIYDIPETIQKTVESSQHWLRSVTDNAKGKSNFYFTGCGTAFFSAMLGSSVFSLREGRGLHFECLQALELTSQQHSVGEDSATFGVSHSGITKATLDAMRRAKSGGGYTVGITHFAGSPISRVVDQTIVVGNGPDRSRCHTKCYLASALPLALIGVEVLNQRRRTKQEPLQEIQSGLLTLSQLTKNTLAATEARMKELAEQNAQKRTYYFAGTGASYPNALEAALKVMETSYLSAQGFETEQLLHGPWVSLDRESVVFVIATERRTHERSMDLVRAAMSLGSTVIPVTYEDDREIASICKDTIQVPQVQEELAPYLSIIPLYLFAYYLCLHRGYNPDYLRYLTPAYWDARTIIFPPGTH
jgi:glucosamine--fructose-6-phosphate aminotransferase (isomerizing)